MTIRPARAEDAAAIAAIWNHYIRDTVATFNSAEKAEEVVARSIAANPCFLVAEEEGIEGFATFFQFRGGIGYRHTMEHTILLRPGAEGRGHGRALMTSLEAEARAQGAHSIFAGVSGENPDGVAFHAALGFETVARLPEVGFKYGRWMDLVLMQKRL